MLCLLTIIPLFQYLIRFFRQNLDKKIPFPQIEKNANKKCLIMGKTKLVSDKNPQKQTTFLLKMNQSTTKTHFLSLKTESDKSNNRLYYYKKTHQHLTQKGIYLQSK